MTDDNLTTTTSPLDVIDAAVNAIERVISGSKFIAGRYPYTYAYDYVRSHWVVFKEVLGLPGPMPSRSEMSAHLQVFCPDPRLAQEMITRLADAYLREHHIERS